MCVYNLEETMAYMTFDQRFVKQVCKITTHIFGTKLEKTSGWNILILFSQINNMYTNIEQD